MKPKTQRPDPFKEDRPLSLDTLLRMEYEPPRVERPDAMRSFAGWSGLMFDQPAGAVHQRVGFTRLETREDAAAWVMTADHTYRLGLPILSTRIIERPARPGSSARGVSLQEPLHQAWNPRYFNPVPATIAQRILRDAKGERVIPTDALDALIFGVDDRKPYYPSAYPWNCVGRLETETGAPIGSASLVGKDLVLTARHVILEANATSIKFVPGYYNGVSTVSPTFFSWVQSAAFYEGSEAGAWDFALLRLYQPLGEHLGFFGVRTYDDDWEDLSVFAAAGYPSMSPFNNQIPSYLIGIAIDDDDSDGDASQLESENQDNSKGNSGGPLWAVWPKGPYIVGVTSGNHKTDYGPFGNDYYVIDAGGKAMADLVALARLEIDTTIHVNPPHLTLTG